MLVKVKSNLFKNLLYVKEVAEAGSISAAAEKNGMKISNLSKLIKDTEAIFGKELFCRTRHGVVLTKDGVELVQKVHALESGLDACLKYLGKEKNVARLYVAEGIEIKNLADFKKLFLMVDNEQEADVIVSVARPKKADELVSTKNQIGTNVAQSIWVCAENTTEALELARFIILQIHHQ